MRADRHTFAGPVGGKVCVGCVGDFFVLSIVGEWVATSQLMSRLMKTLMFSAISLASSSEIGVGYIPAHVFLVSSRNEGSLTRVRVFLRARKGFSAGIAVLSRSAGKRALVLETVCEGCGVLSV